MLSSKQRKALTNGAHALKPVAVFSAETLSDAIIAHVRGQMQGRELIKVRILAETGKVCEAAGREVAERVPCEFVQRVGRIVILYRAQEESRPDDSQP